MLIDLKLIGAILAGVFVGAVVVEILNKKNPKLIEDSRGCAIKAIEATKKSVTAVKDAFVEGFTETSQQRLASGAAK